MIKDIVVWWGYLIIFLVLFMWLLSQMSHLTNNETHFQNFISKHFDPKHIHMEETNIIAKKQICSPLEEFA